MPTRLPARTFRDLIVWQKAHRLAVTVYRFTAAFPKHERYCLTQQMRRAAISVPANIAEGFTRRSDPDKLRFYNMAQGSIEESRYYLILSQELGYGRADKVMASLEEASRLLRAFARAFSLPPRY